MPETLKRQASNSVRRAAAEMLVEEAGQLERSGLVSAAEVMLRAAVRSDNSPAFQLRLGHFLTRTEQYAEAAALYESLWQTAHESADAHLMEVAVGNLAVVKRSQKDSQAAAQLQARSAALAFEQHPADRPLSFENDAADLTNRALDAMGSGDYDLAENLLLRSLTLERQSGSRAGEAADYGNLGVLAGLRGDLNVGMRFLARAYSVHREIADEQGAGSDMLNLAEFVLKLGRLSLTARCLLRAVRHFKRCGAEKSAQEALSRFEEVRRVMNVLDRDPLLN